MSLQPESARKFAIRSIVTSARNMGAHILHTTEKIVISMRKTEWKKPNSCTTKKGRMKPNPSKLSFAQSSKKLEKLEKAIKKQCTKGKKRCRSDSDFDSE